MTFGKANHPDQTFSKCRKRKITHLLENPLQSQVYTPQLAKCLRPQQVYIKTSLPRSGPL